MRCKKMFEARMQVKKILTMLLSYEKLIKESEDIGDEES